jgi:Zn finger protein HypA/HybF involved in hydrogenase expression
MKNRRKKSYDRTYIKTFNIASELDFSLEPIMMEGVRLVHSMSAIPGKTICEKTIAFEYAELKKQEFVLCPQCEKKLLNKEIEANKAQFSLF